MFTETERKELMANSDAKTNQGSKLDFKKIDRTILDEHTAGLKSMGFTVKGLKEQYDKIPFDEFGTKFRFGLATSDLPKEVYSGSKGLASDYIDKRLEILNELVNLFQSVKGPEDLHKITAFLEMSKKAAIQDPKHAAHYIEAIEAAKATLDDNKDAYQNFKDYEKSFIYDPEIFSKTLRELTRRRDDLKDISKEGFDSFEKDGWSGRLSQHGLQTGLQAYGTYLTGESLIKTPETLRALGTLNRAKEYAIETGIAAAKTGGRPELIKTALRAEEAVKIASKTLLDKAPILGRVLGALQTTGRFISKYAGTALGAVPLPAKICIGAGLAVWGTANIVLAWNDKNSFLNNIGTTVGKAYYGNAKNFWAATASWIAPGFGTLYGTDYFTNEREKRLKELQELQGVKA